MSGRFVNVFRRHCAAVLSLLPLLALLTVAAQAQAPRALPTKLTSAEYWKLVTDISEPGGYFQITDNYTSNEREIAVLFTMLKERNQPASVYMGVGPEQNFSYIASLRPKMAFIVDIRRQAVMQHLMFKAMFELSTDRADFISILFSKPRPPRLDSTTTMAAIWDAFWYVPVDTALQSRNYTAVVDRLTKTHGFIFTAEETRQLQAVLAAFPYFGPEISTRGAPSGRGGGSGANSSTFADLTGYLLDNAGKVQSFMATEGDFQYVKRMHDNNLIVAVSGDFGGPKAIRAIGAWLKENGGMLSAFYVSNVEQYLFGDGKATAFYNNVATLPLDANSIFIRPYALRNNGGYALCPVLPYLAAAAAGRTTSHNAALTCPR
jgi:hypothetical protein